MRAPTFILDRKLFELLKKEKKKAFTTFELRDAYTATLKGQDFKLADVRLYVYEEIRRMVRVGWVVPDKQKKSRGQIFHIQNQPADLNVELIDDGFTKWMSPDKRRTSANAEQPKLENPVKPATEVNEIDRMEALLKEIKLELLVSLGEAERYKQLMSDFPEIKDKIEKEYLSVRDQGSRLLGHLRATEKGLQFLTDE